MEQIYPLREEVLSKFGGMPVVVINKTGYRQFGIIHSCQNGKLVLSNPYNSGSYYGARRSPYAYPDKAETDEVPHKEEKQPLATNKKKKRKAKAAGLGQSPTKYASESHIPASSSRDTDADDTFALALDEIAFVFLAV